MSEIDRVLVVDDDHDIVESIRIRLHAAGYETLFAYDGQKGFESAVKNNPDAILLDVRMPEMDGMTALAKLKRDHDTQGIPVVMLSASLIDQHAALRAGADFFVIKPYSATNLLATLDAALRLRNRPFPKVEPV
jgi:DNA-binding response OmpR family regulator